MHTDTRPRAGHHVAVVVTMVIALTVLSAFLAPAQAAVSDADRGSQVVLWGRVDVPTGETSGPVVVFHGPVTVDGVVDGAVSVSTLALGLLLLLFAPRAADATVVTQPPRGMK